MTAVTHSITTTVLSLALDAAALRQQAIAANVANHGTPDYVPVQLDFAAQFEDARRAFETSGRVDAASLAAIRLELQPRFDADGLPEVVHLDGQMADLAQNTAHHHALTKALSRHFAILSTAVNDGKR
jgi:flagellar basal-body rod protein FlgB